MAYTEFYCQNGGSNLNAGSTTNNTALYTSTSGNWVQTTRVFTPTDGSTPASTVSVGMFASVYLNAASVGVYIGRISAVGAGVNGTITIDVTAILGSAPANSTGGITIKVGGAWLGPNGASTFPFSLGGVNNLKDSSDHLPRVNFKNDQTYSMSVAVSFGNGPAIYQGYTSTVGDGGKATFDTSTNAVGALNVNGTQCSLVDLIAVSTASAGSFDGITISGSSQIIRCVAHGWRNSGFNVGSSCYVKECEAYDNNKANAAGHAGFKTSSSVTFENCIAHDNTGSNTDGFTTLNGANPLNFVNCIADTNGRHGFSIQANTNPSIYFLQCDAYNNGTDGIKNLLASTNSYVSIKNCNFVKNGGYGINSAITTGHWSGVIENCGFGSGTQANGSGTTNGTDALEISGSVTYAANLTPWNNPANGDFRITLASAMSVGRSAFTETAAGYAGTVGYPDIGSAQHLDTVGTVQHSSSFSS